MEGLGILKRLITPAGLNINAKTPDEVAISILAQIVKEFRENTDLPEIEKRPTPIAARKKADDMPEVIVNPVCNLPISRASSKYTVQEEGNLLYFCCDGCKVSFDNNKKMYLDKLKS